MRTVLVTQRVEVLADRGERRDALDQHWISLLLAAGLQPVPVPNNRAWVCSHLAEHGMRPLLLTGGNSLEKYGGDAPERDEIERLLLDTALKAGVPVLGVCRGMQLCWTISVPSCSRSRATSRPSRPSSSRVSPPP